MGSRGSRSSGPTTPAINITAVKSRHRKLPKAEEAKLPNIPVTRDRFPRGEIKRALQMKRNLKSNDNIRFLVAIAEKAVEQESRAKRREDEIRKAQEATGSVAWHIIRPLSRDPKFGRYIAALQQLGASFDWAPPAPRPTVTQREEEHDDPLSGHSDSDVSDEEAEERGSVGGSSAALAKG
ncbi:hypothetical protein HK101_009262, partial [Irineochytrium annulatum]